jgi:uncharacterized protein (DUF924 family)
MAESCEAVLEFWLGQPATDATELAAKMKRWYRGGAELDAAIVARFRGEVETAVAGGLEEWLAKPKGWLALIILLDQFTRNVFRDEPRTYAGDHRALALAHRALDEGWHAALGVEERNFALMPLVHSEDLASQERAVTEMARLVADAPEPLRPILSMGIEQTHKYRDIIQRFGRFPHRNRLLGRASTPEEEEFAKGFAERQPPSAARALFDAGGGKPDR